MENSRSNKHNYCNKCRKIIKPYKNNNGWNGGSYAGVIWCNSCYKKEMVWRDRQSSRGGYIPA